jgi:serine protease Do
VVKPPFCSGSAVPRSSVESATSEVCSRFAPVVTAVLALAAFLLAPRTSFAVDPLVLEAQANRVDVIRQVSACTVAIFAPKGDNGGSGVLIRPDGLAVTNFHVVQGLGPFMKCGLNDGEIYDAVLIGIDPTGDVALIQLLGRDDFPVADVGDSDALAQGDWVYVVGNPFLLATDFTPTVTYGIVSGTHRYQYPAGTILEYTDCIQTDASINPGNSGGPLFNSQGQLVGINGRASFERRGRVNTGAGYAISINQVMNFLDHLQSGRIVDHATLGATVQSQTDGSVVVESILEQSDAYRRGLRAGDEIVSFAGRPIRSVNQFKNILGIYPKGWRRPLVYRRDGQRHEVMVTLRALHSRSELIPDEQPELMPIPEQPEGEDDNDDSEKPEGPQPGQPIPREIADLFRKPDIPEEHAHLYEERSGYANYRFNKLHRERVYEAIADLGEFTPGAWQITGEADDGTKLVVKLNDQAVALELGADPYFQSLDEPFADQPPGSGGLLAAMHQLRLMLTSPADRFTEFFYVGSEPLDGDGERVDVLHTSRGTVTSRWYFLKSDGSFVGFDTEVEPDVDPCQVRIDEIADVGGRPFPRRIRILQAGEEFAAFTLTGLQMGGR